MQKKQEAHARRVRQSLKKYLRRKREALKPKVEAAKKCAGCSLEVFDEDNNTWKHMRVNRVDVKWLEGGVTCRIRYEVQPVDDMERMSGPPYWLDLEDCRYYISQRVAPDPETRRIWEHNEAEAAIAALPGFRIVTDGRFSLFTFRFEPAGEDADAATAALLERINADGRTYLTQTRHQGQYVIRFQVGQFDCTREDVITAVEVIGELAAAV